MHVFNAALRLHRILSACSSTCESISSGILIDICFVSLMNTSEHKRAHLSTTKIRNFFIAIFYSRILFPISLFNFPAPLDLFNPSQQTKGVDAFAAGEGGWTTPSDPGVNFRTRQQD
jgi:hypothetical protein